MKGIPGISLLFRPRVVREVAAERTELAAVFVNGVNGVAAVTALTMTVQSFFTVSLIALIGLLFGPLAGLVVSSLYSRIEWTVGARLGGKASRDEIYRIFAWSFVPVGFALLLYVLILLPFNKTTTLTSLVASIPSLIIVGFAVRSYCSNIIAAQKFTWARGITNTILTFILFLLVCTGGIVSLSLLYQYGSGENLRTTFSL